MIIDTKDLFEQVVDRVVEKVIEEIKENPTKFKYFDKEELDLERKNCFNCKDLYSKVTGEVCNNFAMAINNFDIEKIDTLVCDEWLKAGKIKKYYVKFKLLPEQIKYLNYFIKDGTFNFITKEVLKHENIQTQFTIKEIYELENGAFLNNPLIEIVDVEDE